MYTKLRIIVHRTIMRYMTNKKELQVRLTLRSDAMNGIVRYTMNVLFISHVCDQPEPE
jgi:hypothetical protein